MYTWQKGASVSVRILHRDWPSEGWFFWRAKQSFQEIKQNIKWILPVSDDLKKDKNIWPLKAIRVDTSKLIKVRIEEEINRMSGRVPSKWMVWAIQNTKESTLKILWHHVGDYANRDKNVWNIVIDQTERYSSAAVQPIKTIYSPKPENPVHETLKHEQQLLNIKWGIYTNQAVSQPPELNNLVIEDESAKKAVHEALKKTQQKAADVEIADAQLAEIKQTQQKAAQVHVKNVIKTNNAIESTINNVSAKRKSRIEDIAKIWDNNERNNQLNQIKTEILIGDLKNRSEDMNVNIQNFAQEKKNTLIELIGDPDMREKLNQKQISAEELLVIPEFMEMYISAKSHALIDGPDTEDKMDYLHIERLATVVKDTANSQAEVIAAWQASNDAEEGKDQAMKAYMDSAEDLKRKSTDANMTSEKLSDAINNPDQEWRQISTPSDMDPSRLQNGEVMRVIGGSSGDGLGNNFLIQKDPDGNSFTFIFPNGDRYKVDSDGPEAQKKEIEFIKTMSATPVMRRLIGMGNAGFDEFTRTLQSKNPQATIENPTIFMNTAMNIIGKLVWEKDVPQNFADGKSVDKWIRDYMNTERITNWRKSLKEKWIMKEDNSLNSYVFNEATRGTNI